MNHPACLCRSWLPIRHFTSVSFQPQALPALHPCHVFLPEPPTPTHNRMYGQMQMGVALKPLQRILGYIHYCSYSHTSTTHDKYIGTHKWSRWENWLDSKLCDEMSCISEILTSLPCREVSHLNTKTATIDFPFLQNFDIRNQDLPPTPNLGN